MQTKRFVLIWLAFTAIASAQNFYPKKDAVFGQVVVGDGFETVINITNRGTHPYVGTLGLFRTVNEESVAWNPTVNGVAVQDGEYGVEIQPQATLTLRLTGSQLESRSRHPALRRIYCWTISSRQTSPIWCSKNGQGERQCGHRSFQGVLSGFHPLRRIYGDGPRPSQRRSGRSSERPGRTDPLFSGDGDPMGPTRTIRRWDRSLTRPSSCMNFSRSDRWWEEESKSLPTFPFSERPLR